MARLFLLRAVELYQFWYVSKDGLRLCEVSAQSEALCRAAIRQNPLAIRHVKRQTRRLVLLALKQDGLLLRYVRRQTPAICKRAIAQNPAAIAYIKRPTEALYLQALEKNGLLLNHCLFQTPRMCERAVRQNGLALESAQYRTRAICRLAIHSNPEAIMFVPVDINLWDEAILLDEQVWSHVPYAERERRMIQWKERIILHASAMIRINEQPM